VEFILLMNRIKCWLNTPLQVLTVAPALHSLIVRDRTDAAHILEFLFHNHCDLRKLSLEHCWVGEDGTGLLANVVDLYLDLESLSLTDCRPLTRARYDPIPRLKKLSELKLSECQVHYIYVKLLETHVVYVNAFRRTLEMHFIYLGKKEIYCIFKTCCLLSNLFSTKPYLFHALIIFCSRNTFFIRHVLKFKYPPL